MTTPKQVIRRHPEFAAFQKFLVSETSVGNISRQEVVSMIPPLLLNVQPGMTVLDLCAAPGSKAAQLLEMIHNGEEARIRKVIMGEGDQSVLEADPSDDGRATGLLIANDADYKRAQMLIHQLKRISSPNMIVTNHDATIYPSIKLPPLPGQNPKQARYLKFDRILADVPCSGDGTLRKNCQLWNDWNPNNAMGLHITQVRILVRALQMLKVGGRVVYSTCSMNPVENESVVYAAVERCGGLEKVDIVDCSRELPELVRRPGMREWCVPDKTGRIFHSWEALVEARKAEELSHPEKFVQSMFPRVGNGESTNIPIERCMRVYPHLQDTGGFFIAVLEKKTEIRVKQDEPKKPHGNNTTNNGEAEANAQLVVASSIKNTTPSKDDSAAKPDTSLVEMTATPPLSQAEDASNLGVGMKRPREDETGATIPAKRARSDCGSPTTGGTPDVASEETFDTKNPENIKKPRGHVEDPFKFLPPDHEVLNNIHSFYQISRKFPRDRYMVRNAMSEPAKAIYYASAIVRDVLVENESRAVKFVHGGVKMYVKQEAPSAEVCRWRIQSDGLPILEGYVGEDRVVYLSKKQTLHRLLIEMFPVFKNDEWQKLGEIGERIRDIGMGCCVLRVEPTGDDPAFTERMVLPLWKSVHSLNLMLPKEDRSAMLLRIYNDTSPVVNLSLKKREEQQKQQQENGSDKEENGHVKAGKEHRDTKDVDITMAEDAPSDDDNEQGENKASIQVDDTTGCAAPAPDIGMKTEGGDSKS